MGKIVATPTAGSCGIIPGALLTIADEREIGDKRIIDSLFVASGIGIVIGERASLSGATAGCQAECGSASAMAAGSIANLLGENRNQIDHAVSIALSNLLGLICDPVAGLVEIPCIKRNAIGTSNALISADMALAKIENEIPADEVIEAMQDVGKALPEELKETSKGGVAATPTGEKIRDRIQKKLS